MTPRTFVRARSAQIGAGPRTRRHLFGGLKKTLGNIGNAVKKGVVDTGHFVGQAATNPWVDTGIAALLAATGVGVPAAAGIMAGVKGGGELIKPGGNLGKTASGAVKGAAAGAAAGLAGKALGGLTGGAIGAGGGGGSAGGTLGGIEAAGKYLPQVAGAVNAATGGGGGGILGGIENIAGKGLDFLTGNGGANALGIAQALNAIDLQKQSSQYAKDALAGTTDSYNQRAPLRSAGIQGMLNPITPDLSALMANSGPYAKGLPPIQPAARYTGGGYTGPGAGLTAPGKVS